MTEAYFSGIGGRRLLRRAWTPAREADARAVVVIAHGAGEHSGRYQHVAARLVDEGFAVYALDHRGHGRSEGPRALIERLRYAVSDLDAVVVDALGRHPGTPLFLLGHSMGGTLGLCYALRRQERLAGLLLSGPLAALEAAPAWMRMGSRVLSGITPRLPLVSIDASLISRDPAVVQAYVADPLVYHGRLPARTVAELARAVDAFPVAVRSITVPTLIMYGTADGLCPPRGSVMLGEEIGAADKTVIAYEGVYHEILNEPERERVLGDVGAWLGNRVGAPAAG